MWLHGWFCYPTWQKKCRWCWDSKSVCLHHWLTPLAIQQLCGCSRCCKHIQQVFGHSRSLAGSKYPLSSPGFQNACPLAMKGENYIPQITNFLPLAVHIIFITSVFTLPRNILLCGLNTLQISLWLNMVINTGNGEESVIQWKGKIGP